MLILQAALLFGSPPPFLSQGLGLLFAKSPYNIPAPAPAMSLGVFQRKTASADGTPSEFFSTDPNASYEFLRLIHKSPSRALDVR